MKTQTFIVITIVLAFTAARGATWRVEQDGSGDFAIIQDAVDASAPGDTVLIGPGHYTDTRPIPNWEGFRSTIAVYESGLVIQGAGITQTIIGDGVVDWYYHPVFAPNPPLAITSLTLSDLTIAGGWSGIHYESDGLTVERCKFYGMQHGIIGLSADHGRVSDCEFWGLSSGLVLGNGSSDWTIESCRIDGAGNPAGPVGVETRWGTEINIKDSTILNASIGIQYGDASTGRIERTVVRGATGETNGVGIAVGQGSHVHLENCTVDYSMTTTEQAVAVYSQGGISGSGNVFKGGGTTTLVISRPSPDMDFHGNMIYKANQYSVVALLTNPDMQGPYEHVDLTSNYWGTDIPALIDIWIDDANDHPNNSTYWLVVDYEPFLTEPVPVAQQSLSDVKSLFR